MIGIYKITSPTGKVYIGQSVDIQGRKWKYMSACCKNQTKIYHSILKHGWNKHIFEVIEQCDEVRLNALEAYYIELFDCVKTGLNLKNGGNGARLTDDHKNKIAKSLLGKKRLFCTVYKMSIANRGKKDTPEKLENKRVIARSNYNFINYNRKLVIDLSTGIFYESLKEAVKIYGLNYNTTKGRLNGSKPNNTGLVYA